MPCNSIQSFGGTPLNLNVVFDKITSHAFLNKYFQISHVSKYVFFYCFYLISFASVILDNESVDISLKFFFGLFLSNYIC